MCCLLSKSGVAVLLLPFFITASFLRIGNLANDNKTLGKRLTFHEDLPSFLIPSKLQDARTSLASLWKHFGPISSFIHIICATCLLLSQTLMDSVLIKYGFLEKGKKYCTHSASSHVNMCSLDSGA